ncbi:MAG TPA: DUF1987 domain-containing protein [Flavobacteriales bacterium]|nr:DUF1987 domain-containing protein [Flavobacteriales bacterium]
MEDLTISATELCPEIILKTTGLVFISGRSMAEDASAYYKQVHEWVQHYIEELGSESIAVEIDLSYFNSSSAKQLLKLLMSIKNSCLSVKVNWYYPESNLILLDRGKELSDISELDFEYFTK